jgi:hypothetical protein
MARDVNITITNFNPGTGPANASVDINATWLTNAGVQRSAQRTGVTLAQLWSRPRITPEIKQEVLQDLIWKLVRIDQDVDGE